MKYVYRYCKEESKEQLHPERRKRFLKTLEQIILILLPAFKIWISYINEIVSSKIYNKRDEFNFVIVNFPFLGRDVPHSQAFTTYFDIVCFHVSIYNKAIDGYHTLHQAFSKFYHRHLELIVC